MLQPELAIAIEDSFPFTHAADRIVFMLDWSQCPAVERTPEKVSGAWVFKGTRVPVNALFENIEDGARVDDLLQWFPPVTREQVEAVVEHARRSLVEA